MSVESIQCPECGSSLEVERSDSFTVCTYCGSRLRVTEGASGDLMGILDQIKADTSILAKRAALEHAREQLEAIEEERDEWWELMFGKQDALPKSGWEEWGPGCGCIVSLVAVVSTLMALVAAIVQFPGWEWQVAFTVGLWALFALFTIKAQSDADKREALAEESKRQRQETYGPLESDINRRLLHNIARVSELESEINHLADEL